MHQRRFFGRCSRQSFLSNDEKTAFISNKEGFFVGGCPENIPFLEEINKVLAKEMMPDLAANEELDYVLFYPNDGTWETALPHLMEDLLPIRSGRMTFSYDLQDVKPSLDTDIVPVDLELLNQQHIIGMDDIIEEIEGNWPSLEAFGEKGFGCAAIQNTEEGPAVVSWCLTDWVVGNECELGIETDEDYRNQGWARKTASGALTLAKQRGMTRAGWQCWYDNIGSQKTALSIGFKLLADFPVLFGWNHPDNNLLINGNVYMAGHEKYGLNKDYAHAARCYAEALDKGWDWGGDPALYWNAACMFYLTGETEHAVHYYQKAIEKGWLNRDQSDDPFYVYREEESGEIGRVLGGYVGVR
ncbi:GNAT family N-acetyltransferase [Paenibacillus donghaensis]|uniref:GNAT family N-acetyltransferase n=1 Tax=Paenibacillus donghaensis TaxID=414771 RepID=UPI002AD3BA52|nr:GNAT family N-acetyltransferase [Paenibacillus donghaensis]